MHKIRAAGLEWLFGYSATLQPPEVIGPVPEGIRVNFHVTGGRVQGGVVGTLRPVGGDWFTLRRDGIGELDVRATLETADGALIYMAYRGIADMGPQGYEEFLAGTTPPTIPLYTSPVLRTSAPAYEWLQRVHLVGVGVADLAKLEVAYDIYAVR